MSRHKNVQTVLTQSSGVGGAYRTRKLTYAAGKNKMCTVHKEFGCVFAVDVEACYFSPRLQHERCRITQLVKSNETIVNMFAGVGCFSILIAKQAPAVKVFSIDINPVAVKFMEENIQLNRVCSRVVPLLGDSKAIIENQFRGKADRVLMPLPEKALAYLLYAISALKPFGGWIHYHAFEHATKVEDLIEKAKSKLDGRLSSLNVRSKVSLMRVVRRVGPNLHQIVADVYVSGLTSFNNMTS